MSSRCVIHGSEIGLPEMSRTERGSKMLVERTPKESALFSNGFTNYEHLTGKWSVNEVRAHARPVAIQHTRRRIAMATRCLIQRVTLPRYKERRFLFCARAGGFSYRQDSFLNSLY